MATTFTAPAKSTPVLPYSATSATAVQPVAPLAVPLTNGDVPQMVSAPAPAVAARAMDSVWSPLLGTNPQSPAESPASWVMLAASRRQPGAPSAARSKSATLSTGQVVPVAPAAAAVPAVAVINSPPAISKTVLSIPNVNTGAVTGTVTATDPNNDKLTFTATTSIKGAVTITTAGVFTYTPNAVARHAAGKARATTAATKDMVTVTVTDGKGGTATSAVSVPISPANSVPTGKVTVGTPNTTTGVVTGTVAGTDTDRDALTYSVPTTTSKGTVAVNANTGAFVYTPTATARHNAAATTATTAKTDIFTVTINDGYAGSVAVPVTVTISPTNTAPLAGTPVVGTPNATTGVVNGTVSATDANGDPLTFSVPATTAKGAVVITTAGAFTYTPTATARSNAGKAGATAADKADTFTVTITDGYGGTAAAAVNITIRPTYTPPVAGVPTVRTPDTSTGLVTGAAVFSDTAGRTLTFSSGATSAGGGAVSINAATGVFVYTPTQSQRRAATGSTTDTFTVTAGNGVRTATQTITVTVDPGTPNAGTPTAGTPNSSTGVVTGSVSFTDSAGRTLSYSAPVTSAGGGAGIVNAATGAFTYTPTPGQRQAATGSTTDTFTITANNGVNSANTTVTVSVAGSGPVVVATITLDSGPNPNDPSFKNGPGVAVSPDGSRVYVTDSSDSSVRVIDTATAAVVATISNVPQTGLELAIGGAGGVAMSPDGSKLYVAGHCGNGCIGTGVWVIDTGTGTVTDTLDVSSAFSVAVSPDGSRIYATSYREGAMYVFDANQPRNVLDIIQNVVYPDHSSSVAVSPTRPRVYVAGQLSTAVWVIDTDPASPTYNQRIEAIGLGDRYAEGGIAVSPDGSRVYVSTGDSVTVIDPGPEALQNSGNMMGTVVGRIWAVAGGGLAMSADGSRVYVTSQGGDTVSVIDTGMGAVIDTITVGPWPGGLAVSPDGSRVYVASWFTSYDPQFGFATGSPSVSVLDTGR
ncbi:MAG: Ig-like domain-containing protein [Mycobacterium sp.]